MSEEVTTNDPTSTPATNPPPVEPNPPASGSNPPPAEDSLRTEIRKILREELRAMRTSTGGSKSGNIEAEARAAVEAEAAKLVAEKEHAAEHEKLKNHKATPVVESAPKKLRRLTKVMWGGDE